VTNFDENNIVTMTTYPPKQPPEVHKAEENGVSRVTFRVRCESLGHGESVFLVPVMGGNHTTNRSVPLYTSSSSYPWYEASSPIAVCVSEDLNGYYTYRYAIHRAGIFHRWEQVSDIETDPDSGIDFNDQVKSSPDPDSPFRHQLPLKHLTVGETYVVNDVLGETTAKPDIDHIRVRSKTSLGDLTMLHSTSRQSFNSSSGSVGNAKKMETTKKKVGFAPTPPPYHQHDKASIPKKPAPHLDSTDGLLVASAFLPVHLHRSDDGKWTAYWDYEALLSMQTHLRVTRVGTVKWRGWHGNKGSDGSPEGGVPEEERPKVEACLRNFHCIPVWVEPSLFGEMYNGFCKGVLWPVLHNVTSVYSNLPDGGGGANFKKDDRKVNPPSPKSKNVWPKSGGTGLDPEALSSVSTQFNQYRNDDVAMGTIHGDGGKEASWWAAYTAVNKAFADTIVQCFNEGDLVWIHGFHFLILPSFLTRKIPMAKVGLFLHTPFPSSEIFRTLWCREDLLRGMLNADQVGFHLFEYARHFLTCCRRLLGLRYGMIPDESGGHNLAIETNGRHVGVTSIHAGIEPPILNQILSHHSTVNKVNSIRNQFRDKVIFCAIDRMESLKGIPLKMLGLERFLHRRPEYVGKIVLIQVGISAFERGDDYISTKSEVLTIVANINKIWPGTVQFQECSEAEMRLPQRMALLRAADVVMVTPIRDGLNLIPLEFAIAHQDALLEQQVNDGRKRGLCILSEFSSCTRVMRGSIHVNPWKISEIANSFHQALMMPEDERMRRLSTASEFVTRVTTQRWALAVLLDLKGVQKHVDSGRYSGAGLGLGYRLLGMDIGFNSLDTNAVAKAYRKSRARLILMDYGGTILSNDSLDNLSRFQVATKTRPFSIPTTDMVETITELCKDKHNMVFIVSGKERHSLTRTLNNIPNLGLAAEHGMFISWPKPIGGQKRVWDTLVPEQDRSWRSIAVTIMEVYTSRTHGSYIEETEMKVLWQYRDADPEFGYLQAKELEDHLSNVLQNFSLDVLHGGMEEGGFVEVRPKGVNKGVLAVHILKNLPKVSAWAEIDFGLVLGDDHCDEPMLSVMRQVGRRAIDSRRAKNHETTLPPMPATMTLVDVSSCDSYISPKIDMFTCTVGKKPSAAENYLQDVCEVQEFLDSLVKLSIRDKKSFSSVDLRSLNKSGSLSFNNEKRMTPTGFSLNPLISSNNQTKAAGMNRTMSMGNFSVNSNISPARISSNLNEFLGTIKDDEEEEAPCF